MKGLTHTLSQKAKGESPLSYLLERAHIQNRVSEQVRAELPRKAQDYFCGIALKSNELIIFFSNAIWVNRMAYESTALLLRLKQKQIVPVDLARLHIKALPSERKPTPKTPRQANQPSDAIKEALEDSLESIQDEKMKAVFKRLCSK